MGNELSCAARSGGKRSDGKALLETRELVFRSSVKGELRIVIPFDAVRKLAVTAGELRVLTDEGEAVFELGAAAAEKWAAKIRAPRSVLDKLGVKAGMSAVILGDSDGAGGDRGELATQLRARGLDVSDGKRRKSSDLVFLFAEERARLSMFAKLRTDLHRDGALWVLRPKGSPAISEAEVRAAGLAAGLVDVKVVGYSERLSAAKFVIRSAARRSAR